MTDRTQAESDMLAAIQADVAAALPDLQRRGVTLGPLEVLRRGEGPSYESEVRIYAYRDDQLCDALETHLWRQGGLAATPTELRIWFRSELNALGSDSA
jgi:hypothetical protein